jgi:hypothetical protein
MVGAGVETLALVFGSAWLGMPYHTRAARLAQGSGAKIAFEKQIGRSRNYNSINFLEKVNLFCRRTLVDRR